MMHSSKPGWASKWLTLKPSADPDNVEAAGNVALLQYMRGKDSMLETLKLESSSRLGNLFGSSSMAVANTLQNVMQSMK